MTRSHVIIVAAMAGLVMVSPARADDGDEPEDFDAEAEQYSKLWSGDLFPADAEYQDLVAKARDLWTAQGENGFRQAVEMLQRAVAMEPSRPLAYGWLAGVFVYLTFTHLPVYATYELAPPIPWISAREDQQVAGLLMKLGGGAVLWAAIGVLFARWYRAEEA